ncbi:ATP-binding cassette domain-containing protein [Pseudomonas sp. MWU16-30317]|uniref:ABC transporter ATP-binding protein n=1 Tax=Pseudomonas sp. MWU16-30317 TaxID=2878095 RepID=UPI001CFB5697|nr:ATP-binding cassette domain-containing protein [Pseudomonas sp. MWU16-30317]
MANVFARSKSIDVISVNKQFGSFTALNGISLKIEPGEFVCFLGPSGCGKTTLLRMLAGLEAVSSGTIKFGVRDVTRVPALNRDVGIVFQSYALFPNLTVRQNIEYGLVSQKVAREDRRNKVDELVELVRLEAAVNKYPHQISGGQQQRVALARALAINPSILLLDEPLSALDANVRGHLRLQLKELHRRIGLTTIMVTHDQEEAMVLADKVVIMNAGVIEQVGRPQDIYYQPSSQFVANFVGSMNMLEVEVTSPRLGRIGPWQLNLGCVGDGRVGDRLRVCFRPEDGLISSDGIGENILAGVLIEHEFIGPVVRCHVQVDGVEKPLVVTAPVGPTTLDKFNSGALLTFHVPADRMIVLPVA